MTTEYRPARQVIEPLLFWLISVGVGIVAGLGAMVFRALIAFVHNLIFLGTVSARYNANVHTPASPWGPFIVLIPVIGAAAVAFLVGNFAPEAKGHGVPEVMDAVYHHQGAIRPIVALIKSLASAISIGTGGSIGREGPIIQIGSSFGSTVGQALRMPVWQRVTLIAAGAGGGIAATFNTPMGGVLFALEIMMVEVSARTLVPVALATATATYVGQFVFGPHPSFVIPAFETPSFQRAQPLVLVSYIGLGAIMGLVSALFIRSIYGFERLFEKYVKGSYYRQHMTGMLLVGLLMYGLMSAFGHYYIQGVGYATVQDVLSGSLSTLYLLVLLFVLKLLATSLTLGSGASGGVFSPALYMGATLGGAYGIVLKSWFPGLHLSPPAFAVAAMGGVVGGATGAPMAAIVMVLEMTLDYNVVIPMIVTVAISYGVRRLLNRESIYTLKLALRGDNVPESLRADNSSVQQAKGMMDTRVAAVSATLCFHEFAQSISPKGPSAFLVTENSGRVKGVIEREEALTAFERFAPFATLRDIAHKDYVTVAAETAFPDIVTAMMSSKASLALVSSERDGLLASDVEGLITRESVLKSLTSGRELFSE
jgi:chloride channel protein, CIC family